MNTKNLEIIESILRDNILVSFKFLHNTAAEYQVSLPACHIFLHPPLFKGTDTVMTDDRLSLVLYHEWGHIEHYRSKMSDFITKYQIDSNHPDLEFEAYKFAFMKSIEDNNKGYPNTLQAISHYYPLNIINTALNVNNRNATQRVMDLPEWQTEITKRFHNPGSILNEDKNLQSK
jgi:hypothetical protein